MFKIKKVFENMIAVIFKVFLFINILKLYFFIFKKLYFGINKLK